MLEVEKLNWNWPRFRLCLTPEILADPIQLPFTTQQNLWVTTQHMLYPQQWPHILAPGEPKLYNDLTLPEFTAG